MAQQVSNQKLTYLSINSDGFFTSKAEPNAEGAKKTEYEGKEYWRYIYTKTDVGIVESVWVSDTNFGKRFNVKVKSENGCDIINIPLFAQNGGLNQYVCSFANLINKIPLDAPVSIAPSRKKNDKGYVYKQFNIDCGGELIKSEIMFKDLPAIEKKEGIGGTVVYDSSKRDKVLWDLMEKGIKRFSSETNHIETTTETDKAPDVSGVDVNDLPEIDHIYDLPF